MSTSKSLTSEAGEASGITNVNKVRPTYADGRAQEQYTKEMSSFMRRTLIPIGAGVLVFGATLVALNYVQHRGMSAPSAKQQAVGVQLRK